MRGDEQSGRPGTARPWQSALGTALVAAAVAGSASAYLLGPGSPGSPEAIEAEASRPATAADLDWAKIEEHRAHLRGGAPCPVCDPYR